MRLVNVSKYPRFVFLPCQHPEFWDLQVADGALVMGWGPVAPSPDAALEGHRVTLWR